MADTCLTCGGPLTRDWSEHSEKYIPHRDENCIAHLKALIRGGMRVMGRRICADKECDHKHGGWADCVMFRKWYDMARAVVGNPSVYGEG